jgi:hypothetical protein
MEKTNTGILKLHYIDGTEQKFEYDRTEEVMTVWSRIQETMKLGQVIIELEDKVMIVPIQNLKTIEIFPKPEKLPNFAVRNGRMI